MSAMRCAFTGNWHDLLVLARDADEMWSGPAALASIILHADCRAWSCRRGTSRSP
jgi:hypothetical protein